MKLRYSIALAFVLLPVVALGLPAVGASPVAQVLPPWSEQLRRYPYLTDLVGPYATINWATDRSRTVATATWGRVGTESCTAHEVAATRTGITVNGVLLYQWKAQLDLAANTRYCYRVFLGAGREIDLLGSDPSVPFRTQLRAGSPTPFTFAVFGDWGSVDAVGQNSHQALLMELLDESEARFALTTGDNAYPAGSQANYGDLVQRGPALSGVFAPEFWKEPGATMALFPALGNHDLRLDFNQPYLVNWPQDRAVATSAGRYEQETYCCLNGTTAATYPSAWYAFDVGVARFYVLQAAWSDTNIGTASDFENDYDYHWVANSDQYRWLERDLAAHPTQLKFAFFHYSIYSDNSTEGTDVFLQGSDSLEGLLSRNGVALAFSGHAHTYQRNYQPHAESLRTYVTGGGGAKLAPIGALGCSAVDAYGIGWSYSVIGGGGRGSACGAAPRPATLSEVFHLLLVHVDGTSVTVEPINAQGLSFDVQTYDFAVEQVDTTPPTTPSALTAGIDAEEKVVLGWARAEDDVGVQGYTLYRDDSVLATVPATQREYRDTSVVPDTTYRYSIDAFDAQGNRAPQSEEVAISTPPLPDTIQPDTTPPSVPSDLRAALTEMRRVELTWAAASDDSGVAGYLIRRDGALLATVDGTVTLLDDATVQLATTYSYTVEAFDRFGNTSPATPAATVRTPTVVLLPLLVQGDGL